MSGNLRALKQDSKLYDAIATQLEEVADNCVSTVDQDLVRSMALAFKRLAEQSKGYRVIVLGNLFAGITQFVHPTRQSAAAILAMAHHIIAL